VVTSAKDDNAPVPDPRPLARRPLLLAGAGLAVLAVAALAVVLLARGGGHEPAPPPAAVEPLAFMPAGAQAVLDLDTSVPAVAIAAAELIPRLSGATLTDAQIQPLVGGRIAVALRGGRLWLAAASRAAPPRPSAGAAAGRRAGTVVVAPSAGELRTALAVTPAAVRSARAAFDRRFAGLPSGSARVAFDARTLLRRQAAPLADTIWGRSLRDGAAVLVQRGSRLALPFRVHADATGVTAAALPFASGAGAPPAQGAGPIVAATRAPAQTLGFLRSAGLLPALDILDRVPGFLKPDLAKLGPRATIVTADGSAFTIRIEPPDAGDWATKLGRMDALSGLIRVTGLADVRIDKAADGAYTIEQNGTLAARVGVYGRTVVISTDAAADLRAAAAAPATPAPAGAAGALTLRLRASLFGALLPSLIRGHVGDVSGWARAAPDGLRGEIGVPIR